MAQSVQILLTDDIDGGQADSTVTFGLDGINYEIDLSDSNAEKLREAVASFVGHARRVQAARNTRTTTRAQKPSGGSSSGSSRDLKEVRAWLSANGYEVSDRGRVSAEFLEAYDNQRPAENPPVDDNSKEAEETTTEETTEEATQEEAPKRSRSRKKADQEDKQDASE